MQPIKVDDLAEIARKEDVFFLYLQNFGTSLEDLVSEITDMELRLDSCGGRRNAFPWKVSRLDRK